MGGMKGVDCYKVHFTVRIIFNESQSLSSLLDIVSNSIQTSGLQLTCEMCA